MDCFFLVLDQFNNTSHFVSEGELISLEDADGSFELCGGDNVSSKFFCAFVNWFGHLISDMSGSSGSKGRGMGIPSPLWSWANDIIVIKRKFNIPIHEFDKSLNEMAIRIYKEGYDTRFQAAQAIPVLINEMLVRLIYSIRRLVKYFTKTEKEDRTFTILWKTCEPFSNATVKRMLTVAHGTFCMMDVGDAIIQGLRISGGSVAECVMRINIIGVGRFTISLYGELKRGTKRCVTQENVYYLKRKRIVLDDYITGLTELAEVYDDKELISFVEDLKKSDMYKEAFEKTVLLANQRGVPKSKILESKDDIDIYFEEEMTNETKEKNKTSISAGGSAATINKTNGSIVELGEYTSRLYTSLTDIQELFDKIRNVPSEEKVQYEKLKQIRLEWKQQAEKIEKDYRKATVKNAGVGSTVGMLGVGVVTMGPTLAMGVATTFGVASTGTAISTLSGAAATNAALAWLGGGTLAVGGGGMAGEKHSLHWRDQLVGPLQVPPY
ncbi:MAG: hypothetical protein V8S31_06310 [Lachnospiraceae bacterium]